MEFVLLYGPPAAGKLTVGRELARLTGYRLFHNHLAIDYVRPIFDFGSPQFWGLVHRVKLATLEHAARHGVSLISTSVYSHSNESARLFEEAFSTVEREGGRVCLVQLLCDPAVERVRLQAPERAAMNKLTRPEVLEELRAKSDWLTPILGRTSLTLDTTELASARAADRIVQSYSLTRTEQTP